MARTAFLLGVLFVSVPGLASAQSASSTPPPTRTFTKDVAPILYATFVHCHRAGEIGPMPLLTYEDVRPWAKAIKSKVVSREMPPWGADPRHGTFRNDASLSQQQIDAIAAWVDGGAPRGTVADLPRAPAPTNGWHDGEPDVILEMPVSFDVPAEGQVDVVNLYMRVPFKEDVFIKALEIRPTAPGVVHHGGVYTVDRLPEGATIVNGHVIGADGKELSRNAIARANGQRAFEENDKLLSFVPGRGYESYLAGAGQRIKAGSYIYFNMHYQPTGRPERDRTRIGLYLAKRPGEVTHQIYHGWRSAGPTTYIVDGKELATGKGSGDDGDSDSDLPPIPPYAENFTVVSVHAITEPITIYGLTPHLHLRGKSMKYTLTLPDGRDEILLSVPKYDFNWQLYYELVSPRQVPAGSKVTVTTVFDNSTRNKYNPAPEKYVWWSDQSWDEMYAPQVRFTIDTRDLRAPATTDRQRQ
jgi:hypothetical protein